MIAFVCFGVADVTGLVKICTRLGQSAGNTRLRLSAGCLFCALVMIGGDLEVLEVLLPSFSFLLSAFSVGKSFLLLAAAGETGGKEVGECLTHRWWQASGCAPRTAPRPASHSVANV